MYCGKCGQQMPNEADFCPKCGWQVRKEADGMVSNIISESNIYLNAKELATSNSVPTLNVAISEFERIRDYEDSLEQIHNIQAKIKNIKRNKKKKIIKIFAIGVASIFICVFIFGISILEREYQSAMDDYEKGYYADAYRGFSQDKLKYYRNSREMAKKICPYEEGDIITFGTYEQDGDLSNGAEPIEWVVAMHTSDKGYALVSKHCLDGIMCNDTANYVEWENSIAYSWLNDFYKTSFTSEEKEVVSKFDTPYYSRMLDYTDYVAMANDHFWEGWAWSDYVEETYFHTTATEYAKDKVASNGKYSCWWNGYGGLHGNGILEPYIIDAPNSETEQPANFENGGIRPIIYVKLGLYSED